MNSDPMSGYPGASTEQPRHPSGSPSGGRFSAIARMEPSVMLAHLSDEEYNSDGTFEYPPIPRSVPQHVSFWTRVLVPDAILSRVRVAYIEEINRSVDAKMGDWRRNHPEPKIATGRRREEYERAFHDAERAALAARPAELPAVLARPLIRAVQMARYAQMLSEDDLRAVLDTEVDLGGDETWTVERTLDTYHLDELPPTAFEDPGNFTGINAALTQQRLTELVDILTGEADEPGR